MQAHIPSIFPVKPYNLGLGILNCPTLCPTHLQSWPKGDSQLYT